MLTLPASTMRSQAADASGTRGLLSAEPAPRSHADPAGFASLLRQSHAASMPIRVSVPLAASEPVKAPPPSASPMSPPTSPTSASSASSHKSASAAPHPPGPVASGHAEGANNAPPAESGSADPHAPTPADDDNDAANPVDEAPAEPTAGNPRPGARARGPNGSRRAPSQTGQPGALSLADTDARATAASTAAAHGIPAPNDAALPAWLASLDPAVRNAPTGPAATATSTATATATTAGSKPDDRPGAGNNVATAGASDERLTIDSKSPAFGSEPVHGQNAFANALAEAGGGARNIEANGSPRTRGGFDEAAASAAALQAAGAAGTSAGAAAASTATQLTLATPLDSPDFSHALGLQMSLLAKNGVQSAELHLNPAEMGPVSVQITLDGSQAHVSFGADLAETRHAIEAGLPELASALRDAGFTLAGGGVSQHAGQSASQADGDRQGDRNGNGRGGAQHGDDRRVSSSALTDSVSSAARRVVTRGGLDLYA